jgi:hypothetical protein
VSTRWCGNRRGLIGWEAFLLHRAETEKAKAEAVSQCHNCRNGNTPECRVHLVAHGVSLACSISDRTVSLDVGSGGRACTIDTILVQIPHSRSITGVE